MVNIRIPGRGDGSSLPPALVDVAVDTWIRHAVGGVLYIGIAALSMWVSQALGGNTWLALAMASMFSLVGAKYLYVAYTALPTKKRRLRRSRRHRRI